MIKCGNFDYGYAYYECPNCGNFYVKGFTCKSRFCPSCGKKYRDKIGAKVASKLLNVKHRQLVFTVPFELRIYFRKYREFLALLFQAVNETLKQPLKNSVNKAYKKEKKKTWFRLFSPYLWKRYETASAYSCSIRGKVHEKRWNIRKLLLLSF